MADGDFDHLSEESRQKINKIEDNIEALTHAVDDIHEMSKAMHTEVESHLPMLEELGISVQRQTIRTQKASEKTARQW